MKIIKNNTYPKKTFTEVLQFFKDKGIVLEFKEQMDINKTDVKNIVEYSYGDYSLFLSKHSLAYIDAINNGIDVDNLSESEMADFIYKNPSILKGLLILDYIDKDVFNSLNYKNFTS